MVASIRLKEVESQIEPLRRKFIYKSAFPDVDHAWVLKTPMEIRDQTAKSLVSAFKSNKTLLQRGYIKHYDIGFKRKSDSQCISILKKMYRGQGIICPSLGLGRLRSRESLPEKLDHDAKLLYEHNKYWLLMPQKVMQIDVPPLMKRIVSIDPGVRTFATCYSPHDKNGPAMYEWGKRDISRLYRHALQVDRLQSRLGQPQMRAKQRRAIKRAMQKKRTKIKSLTTDLHRHFALWLCINYDLVCLPKFDVSKMVMRAGRKLRNNSVRKMLCWSHFRFRQYLLHKAREHGTVIYLCEERYSSKTCSECQIQHHLLGSNKVFTCASGDCDYVSDRDFNAARNIYMKAMVDLTM